MKTTLTEQVRTSPLVWITAAVVLGVIAGSILPTPAVLWFELAILTLVGAIVLSRLRSAWSLVLLLLPFFLFLGAALYQLSVPQITPGSIAFYNDMDRKVYVTGRVAEPPDVRDTTINVRVNVTALDTGSGDFPVSGTVLVTLHNPYEVAYGDTIRVRAYLKTPRESSLFSYRSYLARQGVFSTLSTEDITILPGKETIPFWSWMYSIHDSLLKQIPKLFPNPEASLMAGILLGADKSMPVDVTQAFTDTGTSHIIAISGFNISIVAMVFVFLFSRIFGKNWGTLASILGITAYTLLVGASPSVVRAAIMGTMAMIGAIYGRRSLAATGLAASALVMTLYNPQVLWDIGFQLSFAATLGLVIFAEPMQLAAAAFFSRYFPAASVDRFIEPFSSYVLLTFAAQLTTFPISIYHFGRISLVSFLANPLVLPAQPGLMILGGLAVGLSKLYQPLGQVFAWFAWPFAAYTIRMVEFFSQFPGGVWVLGEISLLTAILFYVILFNVTFAWARFKGSITPTVLVSGLAVLSFLTWRSAFNLPDGRLHVLFLNVGSADGVLITTPGGKFVLVNGGESPSTLADQLGRRIPPFNRGLDSLIVASTQENEVAALPRVLEQYRPKEVVWAGNSEASFSSLELKDWLTSSHIPTAMAQSGDEYDLGDGVSLHVLAASARGAVLSVELGSFRTILPVGFNFDMLTALQNGERLGDVNALLLADSGYAPANPPEWLKNVNPQVLILSVAADNPDGLPSKEVIRPYEKLNLLRTDQSGWIDLATDGKQFWITAENK